MIREKIIFFGNGALAEYALEVLKEKCEVIFVVHKASDIAKAVSLKKENPDAHGVLASFGVMIPDEVLEVFETVELSDINGEKLGTCLKNHTEEKLGTCLKKPFSYHEGILNIHPSLLPLYRGPSPIETAIIDGNSDFSVSVMKLATKMDAGLIYATATLDNLPLNKGAIYRGLARAGATIVLSLFKKAREADPVVPASQDEKMATYTQKFEKKDGILHPETEVAKTILRQIVAFQGFPKAKFAFYGQNCAILEAHEQKVGETALIPIKCADGRIISVDRLQPDGKKAMDAKSFLNGYGRGLLS